MITTQDVELLGSDSQVTFGGTFEGGYHLQQIPDEIVPCINDILSSGIKVKNFLEIGSAAGGSTHLFNSVFRFDHIVIIDDNNHSKHIHRADVIKKIKGKVKEFIGRSQDKDIIESVKKLGIRFDIILVDGGHSYDDVLSDIENYKPLLNNNGFLIIHDVEVFSYVKDAFKRIGKSGDYKTKKTYISKKHPSPCGIGLLQKK